MASIAYKLGRIAGRLPRPVRLGLTGLVVIVLAYLVRQPSESEKRAAEAAKNAAQIADQRRAECREQENQLIADYKRLTADAKHADAISLIRPCAATLATSELRGLLRQAEINLYLAQINSPKTPPREKAQVMLLVARNYPEVATGFEEKAVKILAQEDRKDAEAEARKRKSEGVAIGMTKEQVLASSWGKPKEVNRTVTAYGEREQWVYGWGNYLYFTNGVLTGIQTS